MTTPSAGLFELQRRRAQIDEEIARAQRGELTMLDAVSQRDRYQQFARTARELLADFRRGGGELPRARPHHSASRSQAGRDPRAPSSTRHWGAVTASPSRTRAVASRPSTTSCCPITRQAELTDLLERLQQIDEIWAIRTGGCARIHFDWIDASERTQATVRLLSDQLRRFLDDQVWLENRRVFDLLRSIEAKALRVRNQPEARCSPWSLTTPV